MTDQDYQAVPAFYQGYVNHVKHLSLFDALIQSNEKMLTFMAGINEEQGAYRYAEGKWSIKELLCHVIDAERIFAYRALRIARNDQTPLAGFDEERYAPEANAHGRTLEAIAAEAKRLRASTIDLFKSFTPEMFGRTGSANGTPIRVIHLGYIVAGHETHHRSILETRYLNA